MWQVLCALADLRTSAVASHFNLAQEQAWPHVFRSVLRSTGQRAGVDWQLSQAEVYWSAVWWLGLHTITNTTPLFPGQSDTPAAREHTVVTASSDVNRPPPLIMCKEGKGSLSGQSALLACELVRTPDPQTSAWLHHVLTHTGPRSRKWSLYFRRHRDEYSL